MRKLPNLPKLQRKISRGFTLLELVVAMTVMAVVAVFSVQFITNAVTLYRQGSDRDSLMSDVRFGLERINREVRNAVPGSLRIEQFDETPISEGSCVRFWPITTASRYLTLDNSSNSSTVKLLDISDELKNADGTWPNDHWLIIYPVDLDSKTQKCTKEDEQSYDCVAPLPLPSEPESSEGEPDNTLLFTFDNKKFTASTHQRVYFAREQVRFCIDNDTGQLTRASSEIENSFLEAQPMAEHIKSGSFSVDNAGLYQMLSLDLQLEKNSETFDFSHKVRLYNAP